MNRANRDRIGCLAGSEQFILLERYFPRSLYILQGLAIGKLYMYSSMKKRHAGNDIYFLIRSSGRDASAFSSCSELINEFLKVQHHDECARVRYCFTDNAASGSAGSVARKRI